MKFTKKTILRAAVCALLSPLLGAANSYAQPTATLTVGTGTSAGYLAPIYSCYGYSYTQQIYTLADIVAANGGSMPATNTITKIRFFYSTASSNSSTSSSNNWTIYMGNTTTAAFASTTSWVPLTALTQVYTNSAITFPATGNWVEFTLASPFIWDGTSNIVVAVDENAPSWDCTMDWNSTTQSTNKVIYYYNDNTNPNPASPPTANSTTSTRANIQFDFMVPPNNTGVTAVTAPTPGDSLFCSGMKEVKVNVHNFGNNVVNSVNVNWKVNGVLQPPVSYTTAIDMENTTDGPDAEVSLGNWDFPYNVPQTIVAWTSQPNGVADTKPSNDSTTAVVKSALLGINNYAITPQDTTICSGTTITLDGGELPENPIYIWNNASLTRTINVSTAGTYGLKVQNTDGCVAYDTITVSVYPNPLVNSIAIIDNEGGSYTFNVIGAQNITSYKWDFDDGTPSNFVNGTPGQEMHTFLNAGQYNVSLVLRNACGEITVTRLVATAGANGTAISNVSLLQKEISVYPNPAKAQVTISNNAKIRMNTIEVFNLVGQRVQEPVKVNADKYNLDIAALPAGIYNVVIHTEMGKITKKLEVVH